LVGLILGIVEGRRPSAIAHATILHALLELLVLEL
jgi:hypothetical protein